MKTTSESSHLRLLLVASQPSMFLVFYSIHFREGGEKRKERVYTKLREILSLFHFSWHLQKDAPFLTHTQVIPCPKGSHMQEIPHLPKAAHSIFPHILVWVVEIQKLQSLPRGQFRPNLKQRLKLLKIETGSEVMGDKSYLFFLGT